MDAVERLTELLDAKDAEIEDLKEKLHDAEEKAELNWEWTTHECAKSDPLNLPIPRLEMRFEKLRDDGYEIAITTFLVYRHLVDDVIRVPLNRATSRGGNGSRYHNGHFSLPYRDGAHIMHDAAHLNLPAFAVDDEGHVEDLSGQRNDYPHQVKQGTEHRSGGQG